MSHVEKRINQLRPPFDKIAKTWLHICRDDLVLDMRVIETLRASDRQATLVQAGKSLVRIGWHQVGLAADFGIFEDGVYITDGSVRGYEQCGQVAEALGCVWGGRWTRFPDYGHIQFSAGMTLQQILSAQAGGIVT